MIDPDLQHLKDEELVAILVGKKSAAKLFKQAGAGGLQLMARWSLIELVNFGALSEKSAKLLHAGLAAGRRAAGTKMQRGQTIASADDAYRVLNPLMGNLPRERFVMLLLDSRLQLISARTISDGTINATIVHPRDVFRAAALEHAHTVIVAHNHPSGQPEPSDEDIALTRRLVAAGDLLGIRVSDHIIVGDGNYYSFADRGLMRG